MAMLRGAEALVECLKAAETKYVYGVIGTSIVGLLDGLYDAQDTIRYISCRHEQVAASMADAEGRLTRRPGVVALHSGPGALNSMISLANAAKDCSPVIAISGTIKRRLTGCDGMLELDHVRTFRPICRECVRVESTSAIPAAFSTVYKAAMSGPGGPALIEIPEDIWPDKAEVDMGELDLSIERPDPPSPDLVRDVAKRLKSSVHPLILCGAGIAYTHSEGALRKLAETWQIPVATTGNGRGGLDETHPLAVGRAGYGGGSPVADEALKKADFVLGIGCTISDMTTYEYTWPIQADLVVVNLDRDNDQKKVPLEPIYADAAVFLSQLSEAMGEPTDGERASWLDEIAPTKSMWETLLSTARSSTNTPLSPALVCERLRQLLPEDAIITVGAGMHLVYAMDFIPSHQPRTFLSAVNFGAMGFGFPAALAAKLIYPDRTVVGVLGDGDFMMTMQDLETAVRENIAVKIFIVNDNAYRVLAFRQKVQFGGRVYGSEHANPDFVKLAECFGAKAWRLERPEDVDAGVEEALACPGPAIVEIVADPNDVPPTNLDAALRMSD